MQASIWICNKVKTALKNLAWQSSHTCELQLWTANCIYKLIETVLSQVYVVLSYLRGDSRGLLALICTIHQIPMIVDPCQKCIRMRVYDLRVPIVEATNCTMTLCITSWYKVGVCWPACCSGNSQLHFWSNCNWRVGTECSW